MNAVSTYQSPLGELLLAADEEGLTGMWFQGQKYFAAGLGEETEPRGLPVFEEAKRWLDLPLHGRGARKIRCLGAVFDRQGARALL